LRNLLTGSVLAALQQGNLLEELYALVSAGADPTPDYERRLADATKQFMDGALSNIMQQKTGRQSGHQNHDEVGKKKIPVLWIRITLMRVRILIFYFMRIRIRLFTLMRIRIRLFTLMRIRILASNKRGLNPLKKCLNRLIFHTFLLDI
jgi:hypothetical protein